MAKAAKAAVEHPQASSEPSRSRPEPPRRTPQSFGKHPGGRPRSRPTAYDEEAIKLFFARLATGLKVVEASKSTLCPPHDQIYQRAALDPEFKNRFLRAREEQQDALVDKTLEIADEATHDTWQVARLRIQAIQWRAARLASKIYGEKSQLNVIVNDALSDRLTAALKRQRELSAAGSAVLIEGVAEPMVAEGSDAQPGLDKSVDIGDNG